MMFTLSLQLAQAVTGVCKHGFTPSETTVWYRIFGEQVFSSLVGTRVNRMNWAQCIP